jgi:hypothetical protein
VKAGIATAAVLHAEKDNNGKSVFAVKGATACHEEKDELGRSMNAMKAHKEKDELGRSMHGVKGAKKLNAQRWKDPLHPELGEHSPGNLVRMQKRRGYPHGKENRVKAG